MIRNVKYKNLRENMYSKKKLNKLPCKTSSLKIKIANLSDINHKLTDTQQFLFLRALTQKAPKSLPVKP